MKTAASLERELYDNLPDLWAITKVMTHCRTGHNEPLREMVWNHLSKEDQKLLRDYKAGTLPEWVKR